MLCPIDQTELRPVERQGIEIDHCPTCRGVWLDRGELDKIVDRTMDGSASDRRPERDTPPPRPQPYYGDRVPERRYDRDDDDDRYDDRYGRGQHGRKRKGWLGELFDFD